MNKRQKEVQQSHIESELKTISSLKKQYGAAIKDIDKVIAELQARPDADMQHVIYQVEYQKALKAQISGILDVMQTQNFQTVADYLTRCYEDGFMGALYDLQGQGIPLCFPLDQAAMVRAIQLDSKISKGLYARLGEDVATLKRKISAQISRGIATGASYQQMAQQLSRMSQIGYNNAVRIARTEGHRIQVQSAMDACRKAKETGADVVKQWDSTLDKRTRKSHQHVDGEIRELEEPFSNGLMFPGDPSGRASEVVNCRCALLERARWAMDEAELQTLQERAAYFGLDKTESFEKFKEQFTKAAEKIDILKIEGFQPATSIAAAEEYARSLGLECSYKGIDLDVANAMNAAFARGLEYCPAIRGRLHAVGSAQEWNARFRQDLEAYALELYKRKFPGYSKEWYKKNAKTYARIVVGTVSEKTYAFARRGVAGNVEKELREIVEKYSGIFVNRTWGKDPTRFLAAIRDDVESKFHPKGTDSIGAIFDHEVAHQIDYALDLRHNPDMVSLWKSLTRDQVGSGLSDYGARSIAEFIAEGYAEYCTSPAPREIASKIGGIIEKAVKKSD